MINTTNLSAGPGEAQIESDWKRCADYFEGPPLRVRRPAPLVPVYRHRSSGTRSVPENPSRRYSENATSLGWTAM